MAAEYEILRFDPATGTLQYFSGADWYPVSLSDSEVLSTPLTGYVSGAGSVSATDTILIGINKLNGNDALKLPLAGGAMTGALTFTGTTFAMTPPKLTDAQMNALTPVEGMTIYNTTSHALAFYNGSAWKVVATV
jgi:hypothetical protein